MWLVRKQITSFILLCSCISLLSGCFSSSGSNANNSPGSTTVTSPDGTTVDRSFTRQISGQVVDGTGGGIEGVSVSVDSFTTTTDANGYYDLRKVAVNGVDQLAITFAKENYATNQKMIPVNADIASYSAFITMTQYHHVGIVDANSTSTAIVTMPDPDDPNGLPIVDISFPSGAIPASGPVTVSIVRGDPTVTEGRDIFPGEYLGTGSADSADNTMLESIAFTEITLNDIDGNEITQMDEPVTVTVKLPAALQSEYSAGDMIPWWSYDETNASWVREDADFSTPEIDDALIIDQGGVLFGVAQVTHFSWWNIDQPISEHSCLCTEVVDEDGAPVPGATLVADGITYNGQSRNIMTDTQGKACVTVKRSLDNNNREKVRLNVKYGGITFPYSAADGIEGEAKGSPVIKTPTDHGSMLLENPGVCLTVKNPVPLQFNGRISGTILNDVGEPLANLTFFSQTGEEIITDDNGAFTIKAPVGVEMKLYKPGLFSETVIVTDAGLEAALIINLPNQAPWLQKLEADINRTLIPGEVVTLTAAAIDPEDGEFTYQWTIDEGYSLEVAEDGTSATFIAPLGGTGTSIITLTLTDDKNLETVGSIPVSWGSEDDSYNLKLVMLDNAQNNTPMEGVVVALHDVVSGAIVERLTSNAQGVVDFGYIGSNRATYSVLYSHTGDCKVFIAGNDYLNTWVDVPVGSNTYYVEHFIKAIPSYEYAYDCPPSQTLATFDLTLTQVPAETDGYNMKNNPSVGWVFINAGIVTDSGSILTKHINEKGMLDVVSLARDAVTNEFISYDILFDQTVTEGEHYNFELSLDNTPQQVPLVMKIPSLLESNESLNIYFEKDGMTYYMGSIQTTGGNGDAALIPSIDDYKLTTSASNYAGSFGDVYVIKRHELSTPIITIAEASLSELFTSPIFQNETFVWSAESNHDFTTIGMSMICNTEGTQGVVWSVLMDKNKSQWTLVEPPAEVSDCLNIRDKIGGYNGEDSWDHYVELTFVDLDITLNKDDFWNILMNGEDLSKQWQQRNEIFHWLTGAEYAP